MIKKNHDILVICVLYLALCGDVLGQVSNSKFKAGLWRITNMGEESKGKVLELCVEENEVIDYFKGFLLIGSKFTEACSPINVKELVNNYEIGLTCGTGDSESTHKTVLSGDFQRAFTSTSSLVSALSSDGSNEADTMEFKYAGECPSGFKAGDMTSAGGRTNIKDVFQTMGNSLDDVVLLKKQIDKSFSR